MRYYKITFVDQKTGRGVSGNDPSFPDTFSSHFEDGTFNPGALEVEFEIANAFGHMLSAQTHIRIHNPTLTMVRDSIQYNNSYCVIEAGFKQGLPLANPSQAGIIGAGVVQNTFANWLGTDLVLDFLLYPSDYYGDVSLDLSAGTGVGSVSNLSFSWTEGPLSAAIENTFKPFGVTVKGSIRSGLNTPPPGGIQGWQGNFQGFSSFIRSMTRDYLNPPNTQTTGTATNTSVGGGNFQYYYGVMMQWLPSQKLLLLQDGTQPSGAISLEYQEFIGQPTWMSDSGMLQSVHPMRSDINLGFKVKYPNSLPTQANPSLIIIRDQFVSPSSGELMVMGVRHMGRFRDTSPTGWVTYVDAARPLRFNPNEPAPQPERVGFVTVGPLETVQ